jgi:hypothetical protein
VCQDKLNKRNIYWYLLMTIACGKLREGHDSDVEDWDDVELSGDR